VLVGEIGGAVQLLSLDEPADLGLLAQTSEVGHVRWRVVAIAWSRFHTPTVHGGAGGPLSIRWLASRLPP